MLDTLCGELCNACWTNDLNTTKQLLMDVDIAFFINSFSSRGTHYQNKKRKN